MVFWRHRCKGMHDFFIILIKLWKCYNRYCSIFPWHNNTFLHPLNYTYREEFGIMNCSGLEVVPNTSIHIAVERTKSCSLWAKNALKYKLAFSYKKETIHSETQVAASDKPPTLQKWHGPDIKQKQNTAGNCKDCDRPESFWSNNTGHH